MRLQRLLAVVPVLLAGALAFAGGPQRPERFEWPAEQKRALDSILALPDSLWDLSEMMGFPPGSPLPPGFNRARAIARFRRMVSAPESIFVGPDRAHHTDVEMIATFAAHARDFERLLAMFQADSTLPSVLVSDDDFFYRPVGPLPPARQAAYERLMGPLGVRMIVRERDLVLFRCTTTHTFDRKGYLWSRTPPRPVIEKETTSEEVWKETGYWRVHRRLAPRWYLYFQPSS